MFYKADIGYHLKTDLRPKRKACHSHSSVMKILVKEVMRNFFTHLRSTIVHCSSLTIPYFPLQ